MQQRRGLELWLHQRLSELPRLAGASSEVQHSTSHRTSQFRHDSVSCLRDPAEYVFKAKIDGRSCNEKNRRRWTLRTLEWILREAKSPRGSPPTIWADVFVARWTS
ncbi:unnamed protein product [Strongylus vulgaris]|uniref:Uncharacterized protein n=1 Tax=Strongylus vulgaris TaxID=40348 RepID=A0A3P7LPN5_STRVU|nr:unnamed protein product [Strongylus vulgaris]